MLKQTILDRYIAKEVLISSLAVFIVLVLIISSSHLGHLLARAAEGSMPNDIIFTVLLNSTIRYSVQLVPVSLFLGILFAFGRFYKDSEMSALNACGVGTLSFYRAIWPVTLIFFVLVTVANLYFVPALLSEYYAMESNIESRTDLSGLIAGRFNETKGENKAVFFMDREDDKGIMYNVFLRHARPDKQSFIETAPRAFSVINDAGKRFFVFENGKRFDGKPGEAEYSIISYRQHGIHMEDPRVSEKKIKRNEIPTSEIWRSDKLDHKVEMQLRLALPISIIILALMAVPLSHTSPRKGRFAKMPLGIFVYLVYSNLAIIGLTWMEKSKTPEWLGVWWVHLLFLSLTLAILIKRHGSIKKLILTR